MADNLTPSRRSANMAAIRSTGMAPEMAVRGMVHKMGFRFRLHRKDLPGKPDLVFPARRKAMFVHGCFWHWHGVKKCRIWRTPKSNLVYWKKKLGGNRDRDKRNLQLLKKAGWRTLVIWECQVADAKALERKIRKFINSI